MWTMATAGVIVSALLVPAVQSWGGSDESAIEEACAESLDNCTATIAAIIATVVVPEGRHGFILDQLKKSIAGELHRIERTVEKAVMPIPDGKGSYRRYAAPNEPLRDLIRNRIVNDVGELVCSESVSSDQRRLRAEVESLHESNRLNEEAYRKALADKDAFIDALEKGDDVEHTLVLLKACRQNNARMRKELEICTKGKNAMMRSAVKFEQLARERAAEVANVTSLWNNARTELANTELEFTEAKRRLGQQDGGVAGAGPVWGSSMFGLGLIAAGHLVKWTPAQRQPVGRSAVRSGIAASVSSAIAAGLAVKFLQSAVDRRALRSLSPIRPMIDASSHVTTPPSPPSPEPTIIYLLAGFGVTLTGAFAISLFVLKCRRKRLDIIPAPDW
ncbi:Uncharacterized protein PBTT_05063 [Plasmodiophora brassicae]